jgi:hypothetical protein
MSRTQPQAESSSVPQLKIEDAMARTAALREEYIQAAQTDSIGPKLIKRWHSSVINYYVELRVYRDNDLIAEKWEKCRMWPDDDGEWIQGMDTLINWVNRAEPSSKNHPGRGQSTETTVRSKSLSPDQLMRVSMLLDEFAHDLGIRIETDSGRPTGTIEVEDTKDE